jgi:probable HAF family extracellular repeat protein
VRVTVAPGGEQAAYILRPSSIHLRSKVYQRKDRDRDLFRAQFSLTMLEAQMSRNTAWTILLATLLSLGTLRAADTFISFDPPGATSTRASGINADGAVVGSYADSAGKQHGFLLSGGSFTAIDYPGAVGTAALGINSQGDIVGQYTADASGDAAAIHGFLLHGGNFTALTYPGRLGMIAQRINDAGQITGCNHDHDMAESMHGFLYKDGNWSELSMGMSMGTGLLPDASLEVGFATTDQTHAYSTSAANTTFFDFPFAGVTAAWDISPSGEIVGQYADATKVTHGFLLIPSAFDPTLGFTPVAGVAPSFQFITVDYPSATYTQAVGINANGHIVGSYRDSAGTQHAFLLMRGQSGAGTSNR